ncbi:unnamed protein product [Cuscuta epithymum]|uniref:Uncharacterized protein n=1 Tax=Cuscuta epithymum TaxID=186058 RepID=A0AAV0GC87_9ASTE|nr:unnamed protein product [Cuscuta epithymum]
MGTEKRERAGNLDNIVTPIVLLADNPSQQRDDPSGSKQTAARESHHSAGRAEQHGRPGRSGAQDDRKREHKSMGRHRPAGEWPESERLPVQREIPVGDSGRTDTRRDWVHNNMRGRDRNGVRE